MHKCSSVAAGGVKWRGGPPFPASRCARDFAHDSRGRGTAERKQLSSGGVVGQRAMGTAGARRGVS